MEATKPQVRKSSPVAAIILGVVLIGGIVGAAYYQQEISIYWRLHGWDTASVKQTMERFIREAHDGQPSAGEVLDDSLAHPVVEGGKLTGVRHSGALGPVVVPVKTFSPDDGTIKDCAIRIKNRSGVFQADVLYPNGQWGSFDVDRIQGSLRIRTVPDALSPTKPQVQPWD